MTNLLRSVVTVIDVFYKYTKQDGECGTLSKDELKELLEKEFRPILKNPDDPDTVEVIMHMLDRDHDRRLDFTEFLLMVFKLAMACNKVLSKEYCKASGSKKHRHHHRHQEEESETEEETLGQKSGYRHSSWSEGEEHGYSSGGSRGTGKHRHGSSAWRLGRPGNLSSSGNQEGAEKRYHGSTSGHSWSSGKERHGSSGSEELEERGKKSHVSPSRESGEEYESGSGSQSQGRIGHGGLSHGLETSGHESNSTQSRRSKGKKLGSG
uniref:EF-hand domain-containing protein n=1 Tax=Propithecus coquereli TaxID=379532 RepID=A0A2K6ER78_PROCO